MNFVLAALRTELIKLLHNLLITTFVIISYVVRSLA